VFSMLIGILIGAFLVRWMFSGSGGGGELPAAQADEIRRLREEVDQLSAQVLRLADEQSFLTRLLAEGREDAPPQALPSPDDEGAAPQTANPEKP
jgi:hypothetical protein